MNPSQVFAIVIQMLVAVLLATTGYLMQSKLTDVTQELQNIATNLKELERRNYGMSERQSVMELRMTEMEKRLLFLVTEQLKSAERKNAP